jgi:hypothetical protein
VSLAGVFFAGTSFAAKLVPSANGAPLQPVPDVVTSSVFLLDAFLIGTHLWLRLVVTVWLSSAAGLLSKSAFFVLAIRSARLPLPCDSPSDSLGSLFAVLGLFSDASLYVPTTIGEVPCGHGVLLSGGLVGVLVAGSTGSGRALRLESGWSDGTSVFVDAADGGASQSAPGAVAFATVCVGRSILPRLGPALRR